MDDYIKVYQDIQPTINGNLVCSGNESFTIVHQWDRVPAIAEIIEREYGDGKCEQILTIKTG